MTENLFCSLNLSLRSNQQLSSEKRPIFTVKSSEQTTEHAQIPGYPPGKDHCIKLNVPYVPYALFLN